MPGRSREEPNPRSLGMWRCGWVHRGPIPGPHIPQSLRAPSTLEDLTGLTQLHADSEAVLALQGSESEEEGLERADGEEDDWHEI